MIKQILSPSLELYAKPRLVGSDKVPVRLGGPHALERLAHNAPEQRQTIVDVICAWHTYHPTTTTDQGWPAEARTPYKNSAKNSKIRPTAQKILSSNLQIVDDQHPRHRWQCTQPGVPAWHGIHLGLTATPLGISLC